MRKIFTIALVFFAGNYAFAAEEGFVYNDKGRRDPLLRLVTSDGVVMNYDADVEISDITLEGIIYDPDGNSMAIVNGRVVRVNDKIGYFTVVEITSEKVVFSKGAEKFELTLKKEE